MSDIKLCTEGDFALSEKLHSEYERAKQARAAAQPRVDAAADAYETACLHRHAAGSLCNGTPQARIEALDAEVARTRAERDRVLAEAEEPYREALRTMLDFDRHFISAASSWLAQIIRDYGDADKRLVDLCQPTRRKLEDLAHKRVPLREIAEYFQPVFEEVSNWRLPKVETVAYGVPHPPDRFSPPRRWRRSVQRSPRLKAARTVRPVGARSRKCARAAT